MTGTFLTTYIFEIKCIRAEKQYKCITTEKRIRDTTRKKKEKVSPNDKYENFVNAHLEATAKCTPSKTRTKYRVSWETLAVREKRTHVKNASKSYRKNPTNTSVVKLKKTQYQLTGIYLKEQTEYIQNQIDNIRDSVEDRQSRIACKQ